MEILIGLFTWIIGLVILYHVIRGAIDSSETAGNIREIRNILSELHPLPENEKAPEKDIINDIAYYEYPDDQCPSCGRKVSSSDRVCPSCGLTLINEER